MTSCSKELRLAFHPKHPLQITMRTRRPAFKFELLPLHSPLLGQSLLVSFPPLIDMLKFSGYPYLIRGQPRKIKGFSRQKSSPLTDVRINSTTPKAGEASPRSLRRAQLRTAPYLIRGQPRKIKGFSRQKSSWYWVPFLVGRALKTSARPHRL